MDWNNDGNINGLDYIHYKMITDPSKDAPSLKSSSNRLREDRAFRVVIGLFIITVVIELAKALGG